ELDGRRPGRHSRFHREDQLGRERSAQRRRGSAGAASLLEREVVGGRLVYSSNPLGRFLNPEFNLTFSDFKNGFDHFGLLGIRERVIEREANQTVTCAFSDRTLSRASAKTAPHVCESP